MEPEVVLSPSADEILDVTPVTSMEDCQSRTNPLLGGSLDDTGTEKKASTEIATMTSEWDKALQRGKSSQGRARDFFPMKITVSEGLPEADNDESDSNDDLGGEEHEDIPPHAMLTEMYEHALTPPPAAVPPPPPPPPGLSIASSTIGRSSSIGPSPVRPLATLDKTASAASDDRLSAGVLPDVFLQMRQKIESLTLFDSDIMKLATDIEEDDARESLKRSSQQSISAAVLVSLAHKRYERRRLAAMEIEKVVRSLVATGNTDRVRAILLLLADDYVRSTSEDARKGGVVALAACAIGLKKIGDEAQECRDLILASVVHACQDHSQRVRYYATESLFNVVKVIPSLAVQHFFILYEILRSLYADTDADVRSGADLLDKKMKEIILLAINTGTFSVEACIPVFARFVHMRSNKATKLLTLTWLQELNEKLLGAPLLEFLHLFLGGIYDMVADPTVAIRQSALAFLQTVLPKLLAAPPAAIEEQSVKVDFDKILQSLVTTMEHPDPFVRKVAMYWMSRIVKAHMVEGTPLANSPPSTPARDGKPAKSVAAVSVRNSVPHLLPGILLSIGDSHHSTGGTKDAFLPEQSTRALAEQTNQYLQDAVRRDGSSFIQHLDAFIVTLREELDSPGGTIAKNPPAIERVPYRMDVKQDGNGIETSGWFRASSDLRERNDEAMVMSRLCALDWITVLYDHVVPTLLKADYAREFISAIIHQLVDSPPKNIVEKSLEVLTRITIIIVGEDVRRQVVPHTLTALVTSPWQSSNTESVEETSEFPMTQLNIDYALQILSHDRRKLKSRDRQVFSALIELHSTHEHLLIDFSNVLTLMCKLQPPEFIFVSFAVEIDRFIRRKAIQANATSNPPGSSYALSDLAFVSSFVQHMNHVLLNTDEATPLRDAIGDCMYTDPSTEEDRQKTRLFHILLHSFSHNIAATLSLCLWSGAYRTASRVLLGINPLDINLMFLLEIDRVVEMLERPFFRRVHVRLLEQDRNPKAEGSGMMLFQLLKSLLMILPQSTCYRILKDRLVSVSRFRQSTMIAASNCVSLHAKIDSGDAGVFVKRVEQVRSLHCSATWNSIRAGSLEISSNTNGEVNKEEGADRRTWLGYASKAEEAENHQKYRDKKISLHLRGGFSIEEVKQEYQDLNEIQGDIAALDKVNKETSRLNDNFELDEARTGNNDKEGWKDFWADPDPE